MTRRGKVLGLACLVAACVAPFALREGLRDRRPPLRFRTGAASPSTTIRAVSGVGDGGEIPHWRCAEVGTIGSRAYGLLSRKVGGLERRLAKWLGGTTWLQDAKGYAAVHCGSDEWVRVDFRGAVEDELRPDASLAGRWRVQGDRWWLAMGSNVPSGRAVHLDLREDGRLAHDEHDIAALLDRWGARDGVLAFWANGHTNLAVGRGIVAFVEDDGTLRGVLPAGWVAVREP